MDELPKYICVICQQKVVEFNEFYRVVHSAQRNYTEGLLKTEAKHDDGNDIDATFHADSMLMEPETVLFEADENATAEIEEMLKNDFGEDQPMSVHTQAMGQKDVYLEVVEASGGNGTSDDEMECEADDAEEQSKVKVEKLSRALINATVAEHFDLRCDLCTAELKTLSETLDHYADEHDLPNGYMKCCDLKLKFRFQVEDHVRWHLDPNVFR